MKQILLAASLLLLPLTHSSAQVDPNFHIYLCFGQSNMEGNAQAESMDKNNVDKRFLMLATTNFDSPSRTLGNWYTATPPIVNPIGSLGVTDYFGRTMVAALPSEVRVGVVAVAIGGCAIEMFDKDKYQTQMTDPGNWSTIIANNHYGGNPYQRLIDMARKAQEVGVIKGILLHQGESNNCQSTWPQEVKKVYNDILADLNLGADSVPLFAGEMLRQEYGGICWGHNDIIARLPQVIPTAHVIPSYDCEGNGNDGFHFCPMGYRILGKRYAYEALRLMGRPTQAVEGYKFATAQKKFYKTKKIDEIGDTVMKCGKGQAFPVRVTFGDGHREDVTTEAVFRSDDIELGDGPLTASDEACGRVEVLYTDFTGQRDSMAFNVDIRFFPFAQDQITSLSESLEYDEATRTFTIGKRGQAGWVYENGVDMSAYKYLVVKLKEQQKCSAQLRIYQQNDISSAGFSRTIGTHTTLSVELSKLKYTENGASKKIDPKDIHIVSFWCNGGSISIDDVYLTNNDDLTPTGIQDTPLVPADAQPAYDLSGRPFPTSGRGIRITGGHKVMVR